MPPPPLEETETQSQVDLEEEGGGRDGRNASSSCCEQAGSWVSDKPSTPGDSSADGL